MQVSDDIYKNDEVKQMLKDAMHEVRKFNATVKANSEMLTRILQMDRLGSNVTLSAENTNIARNHAISILETAQLISARLDLIDFETNPSVFTNEEKITGSIYGKFDKARKTMRHRAKEKSIIIRLEGESHRKSDIYPVFDILPFMLLDNAVKYAPCNTQITINIEEHANRISATVESLGPNVTPEELSHITEKGFRGQEAIKSSTDGSGFGLFFCNFISNIHNARLSFTCTDSVTTLNGINYSRFISELSFPL